MTPGLSREEKTKKRKAWLPGESVCVTVQGWAHRSECQAWRQSETLPAVEGQASSSPPRARHPPLVSTAVHCTIAKIAKYLPHFLSSPENSAPRERPAVQYLTIISTIVP